MTKRYTSSVKPLFIRFLLLVIAATLASCGKGPQVAPLPPDAVVLAFGDSITFGTGASPAESYPAQLAGLIGRKVVNAGVPGEISEDGLRRLPGALEENQPKLLILCHGGNDFLRKLGEPQVAVNVRAMIRLARQKNIDVMLIATPKPGLTISPPDFYAEIAREFAIPFNDDVLKAVLRDNALKSDLVHPNAQGYAEIAQATAKLLKKAGAL
jgi:lysophospholipase L1-like esterase